jgi:prophage antirepressor-like protein
VSDLFRLQFLIEGLYKGRVVASISCCFSPKFWDKVIVYNRDKIIPSRGIGAETPKSPLGLTSSKVSMNIVHCFFKDQEVRFVDGNPVANDVAAVLGYKDPANAVNRIVKPKNKGVCDLQTPGGIQSVAVLKEAGIYQLIFSSKLAGAEEFQDWVFEDVLPSIRKTGSYSLNKPKKEQNALLKEKIRTFQVNTPAQIDAARDEAEKVEQMAYQAANKGAEEIELIAKCHFVHAISCHPKGMTFEQYLPHWLRSMSDRTDIYPREVLEEMTIKAGKPLKVQGKILKHGYSYVWI